MNGLQIAALLLLLLGLGHAVLGERYILMRLARRAEQLPKLFGGTAFTLGTLRFVWHLLALPWGAMAYLLLVASQGEVGRAELLNSIAAACLLSALLPLWFTRGLHLSWLAFVLIGGLVLLAA